MPNVNTAEALKFLLEVDAWLDANEAAYHSAGGIDFEAWRTSEEAIKRLLLPVRQVAQRVAPGLVSHIGSSAGPVQGMWPWFMLREAVTQMIGLLQEQDRLNLILTPVGPSLPAAGLYPRLWKAAAALWDDGHYQQAVVAASASVERQLRQKLDADGDATKLVTGAFSTDPPKQGERRLRFTRWAAGTQSWTNAHQGAASFGRGCMMRIRNLSTHERLDLDEQTALEYLAALSVLARWIGEAVVVTA